MKGSEKGGRDSQSGGERERARYTDIEGEREGVRDSVGECRRKNREKME